jgi:hypothetical protein
MIRSRSIPIVLSRVAGDGIHAILLIDNDGELLGSYGSPPPRHPAQDETNCGGVASGGGLAAAVPDMKWPLDAASIGALISEVAGDYSRMGEDLLLLDPRNYSQRHQLGGGSGGGVDRRRGHEGGQIMDNGGMQQPGGVDSGTSSLQQSGHNARKPDKDKLMDSGTNLKSLVVELDYVSAVQVQWCIVQSIYVLVSSILSSNTSNSQRVLYQSQLLGSRWCGQRWAWFLCNCPCRSNRTTWCFGRKTASVGITCVGSSIATGLQQKLTIQRLNLRRVSGSCQL